ncbi:hypothetical protein M2117_001042 [Aurantimicrobium minutum]|nr:hypothetical protein [Aurantimicrobium minutum]
MNFVESIKFGFSNYVNFKDEAVVRVSGTGLFSRTY